MPDEPREISPDPVDQGKIPGDGPGNEYVSVRGILILAVLLSALAIGLLARLHSVWPSCESICPTMGEPTATRQESAAAPETLTTGQTPAGRGTTQGAGANTQQTGAAAAAAGAQPGQAAGSPRSIEITSIRPLAGPASGGTRVTISGSGFTAGSQVAFDGLPAVNVSVSSGGTILHATAPCHPSGKADVTVTNPDRGTDSLPSAFEYTCACGSESKILLLVILAGALGGVLYSLRSLVWFVGNRKLVRSWIPQYFLVPLSSAVLACVFYLVSRAGFFDPKESTNCLAVVGIAVLVGLFSEEAVEKLKLLAIALLTGKPRAADPAPATGSPAGTAAQVSVLPASGVAQGGETVTILGDGFSGVPNVTFGGQRAPTVTVLNPRILRVVTPPAAELGEVEVVVTLPDGKSLRNPKGFAYVNS